LEVNSKIISNLNNREKIDKKKSRRGKKERRRRRKRDGCMKLDATELYT
jgi:hypothetical protein